jgi:hypothetical protein
MDSLSGPQLVVFLNALLSLGCSTCILIATWPFQGLMMSWFFTNHKYTWTTHIMMTWFDVGCIGLLTTNVFAFLRFDPDSTSPEAYELVYLTNCVMQGLWGAHNLHQWIIILRGADKGTDAQWRRPYPMFLWSLFGACGTGFVRNLLTLKYGANDMVSLSTGSYEMLCLFLILADLGYFIVMEHSWGMNRKGDYGMTLLERSG